MRATHCSTSTNGEYGTSPSRSSGRRARWPGPRSIGRIPGPGASFPCPLAREHHELLASAPRHSPCGVELSPFHLAPHEVDW
jgi:hypothetical protein